MSNLHELLKRAIVRENRDPDETFDAYFGECRKMFKFCGNSKPLNFASARPNSLHFQQN